MATKDKRYKTIAKFKLTEPIKYLIGYVIIYELMRLTEYGLMKLLVSGYADQRLVQYIVFVGAVITGLWAQLMEVFGLVFAAIFALVYAIFTVREKTRKESLETEPTLDYKLNRYVVTFGEKIEQPKAKQKTTAKK
jgi:hypothetical protein